MNYKFENNKLLKFLKQTIIISKLFLLFVFVVSFFLSSNINVFCSEVILNSAAEDIVHYKDITEKKVKVLPEFQYYKMAAIKDGEATLYENNSWNKKNIIVCVNAGHGTFGGGNKWVYSHPDKSYRYSSPYQLSKERKSMAVSQGAQYRNGITEASLNLKVSKFLKDMLIDAGYSVLMIREDADVRLDNIARTILANEYADIEVSIHFDSTENNKGMFYISPFHHEDYLAKYNIKTTYERSEKLGNNIIKECRGLGVKIFNKGIRRGDMTQFAYASIPNVIVECGDGNTDMSNKNLNLMAEGIYYGIEKYFE